MQTLDLRQGHVLEALAALKAEGKKVRCVVTSPPYWGLRAYGTQPQIWSNGHDLCAEHDWNTSQIYSDNPVRSSGKETFSWDIELKKKQRWRENTICSKCGAWRGELGLEPTPELYVAHLVQVFRAVWDVLADDGTLWLNLGDSYASGTRDSNPNKLRSVGNAKEDYKGYVHPQSNRNLVHPIIKPKDRVGIPHMVAFALRADGWYWRDEIVWSKPNPMPESVLDRTTKSHEFIFLFSKSPRYFYDADAVREPMSEATKARDAYKFTGAFKGQFRGTPNEKRWQDGRPLPAPKSYNENGRNRRSVWIAEEQRYRLRRDLTPEQIALVFTRLSSILGVFDNQVTLVAEGDEI